MAALHARLAAVMEALVLAAVAELKKLVEARLAPEVSFRTGPGEESLLSDKHPAYTWETMVRKVKAGAAAGMMTFCLFYQIILCLSETLVFQKISY